MLYSIQSELIGFSILPGLLWTSSKYGNHLNSSIHRHPLHFMSKSNRKLENYQNTHTARFELLSTPSPFPPFLSLSLTYLSGANWLLLSEIQNYVKPRGPQPDVVDFPSRPRFPRSPSCPPLGLHIHIPLHACQIPSP